MTQRNRAPSRRSRSSRGPRARTTWVQWGLIFPMTPSAGPIIVADLTPLPMRTNPDTIGQATLIRAIGTLTYRIAVNGTDPHHCAVAMGVISHEAFNQTALLDPLGDSQQPWYYWSFMSAMLTGDDHEERFDLRTSRRLRPGYKMVMFVNNPLQEQSGFLSVSLRLLYTTSVS